MCLRLFSEVMFHCLRYELYEDILKQRYIKMLRLLHEFRNSLWFQKTIYILNKNSGLSFLCLIRKVSLKWYCDENHIFPIEPILKQKQVACMARKMLFTIFKYLFSFQRYLSF